MEKKIPTFSKVLYIAAGFFAVYGIWVLFTCFDNVSQMASSGGLDYHGAGADIFGYYMTNAENYIFFPLVLSALGYIIQIFVNKQTESRTVTFQPEPEEKNEP
ncbi:MAG: hypothetical protein FWE82_06425 [Defluviitaleaceae bacterium]|nr:hypothetical protein [Defluviitaleaceae bacterium]